MQSSIFNKTYTLPSVTLRNDGWLPNFRKKLDALENEVAYIIMFGEDNNWHGCKTTTKMAFNAEIKNKLKILCDGLEVRLQEEDAWSKLDSSDDRYMQESLKKISERFEVLKAQIMEEML